MYRRTLKTSVGRCRAFTHAHAVHCSYGRGTLLYIIENEVTVEEAKIMYRVITGACRQGTEAFVNSLDELKEKYTIREIIEITKGNYNAEKFAEFFQ